MRINKLYLALSIIVMIVFQTTDIDAQSRRRSSRAEKAEEEANKVPLKDKIFVDMKFGNISFGGGFAFSIKPEVGYKLGKILSAGVNGQLSYFEINYINAPDESFTDYGVGLFLRGKISNDFYLQIEGTQMNFAEQNIFLPETKITFPTLSAGYFQGYGQWKFGFQLGYVMNEKAQDYSNPLQYWFGFTYNY
jgi:hypothetical protein